MSCRLTPSTTRPMGTLCPSVSTLRLTPDLPRPVGLGPVLPPPPRPLAHPPIHCQPVPLDPPHFIKSPPTRLPQLEEHPRFHPGLEPVARRRMRTQLGLVQR